MTRKGFFATLVAAIGGLKAAASTATAAAASSARQAVVMVPRKYTMTIMAPVVKNPTSAVTPDIVTDSPAGLWYTHRTSQDYL